MWARKGFTERTEATGCSFPKPDQGEGRSFLFSFVRAPPLSRILRLFFCHATGEGAELVQRQKGPLGSEKAETPIVFCELAASASIGASESYMVDTKKRLSVYARKRDA